MPDRPLIGLIGFGAIGCEIPAILSDGFRVALLRRPGSAVPAPEAALVETTVGTLEALLEAGPRLVVEAAGVAALAAHAPAILEAGIDLVAASAGALADPSLRHALLSAARGSGARLIVPSGALGGLDYLAALHGFNDAGITYTSRKPPSAWTNELAALGHPGGRIAQAVTLFEGTAEAAAARYPRNLNAGLTLALAVGSDRLRVRVVADPGIRLNTHEIEAESAAGSAFLRFANRPSPKNPKTSAITAHSLAAAVRRHFSSLVV